jgi:hypothetical protein
MAAAKRDGWKWPEELKVYLGRQDKARIRVLAKRRGFSYSELIRYLIDQQAAKEGLL